MKEQLRVCSNCQGNPWLVKQIPKRGNTAYPCPFCNSKRPYRPALDISKEELERMEQKA